MKRNIAGKFFFIFTLLILASLFSVSRASAECADGGSCFPDGCPSGFNASAGSCMVDVPGIEFRQGVCCKQENQQSQQPQNQQNQSNGTAASTTSGSENTGGIVPCNTKCTLCHLIIGFENIFKFLRNLLFVISILFITVSGVLYTVSSGNKSLMDWAKNAITYSLTGFALFLLSWLIIAAVLTALGYKQVGTWATFSCDTTQTQGPSPTANQQVAQNGKTNTAPGDGSCGGVKVSQNSDQCKDTSARLTDVMGCINDRVAFADSNRKLGAKDLLGIARVSAAGGMTITSLGQNQNNGNWKACVGSNWTDANCAHAQYSCHYGGRSCQGQINGADLAGDLPAIRDAAIACGADSVIYGETAYYGGQSKSASDHTTHVHISVNNAACGCDYLR